MVKIDIEFICDKCFRSKKEKTIIIKGYEDVDYVINNHESCYMPDGWSYEVNEKDKTILSCKKCTKKDMGDNAIAVA
jgi:hypothetical protein